MRAKCALVLVIVLLAGSASGTTGLIAHWELNGNANDSVGSNDGTVYGATWTDGVFGQALQFDGDDDYVGGTTSPFGFEDSTFTVSAWAKTTVLGGNSIVSEGAWSSGGWHLAFKEGSVGVMLKDGTPNQLNAYSNYSIDTFNDGTWHHIAAVIATSTTDPLGNHADVYVDGSIVSTLESQLYAYIPSPDSWRIGARPAGTVTFFCGSIDDVRIFDGALSSEEIEALAVPEPATALLLSLGTLLFYYKKRR